MGMMRPCLCCCHLHSSETSDHPHQYKWKNGSEHKWTNGSEHKWTNDNEHKWTNDNEHKWTNDNDTSVHWLILQSTQGIQPLHHHTLIMIGSWQSYIHTSLTLSLEQMEGGTHWQTIFHGKNSAEDWPLQSRLTLSILTPSWRHKYLKFLEFLSFTTNSCSGRKTMFQLCG